MAELAQPLQDVIELSVLPGSTATTQPPTRDVSPSSSARRLVRDAGLEKEDGCPSSPARLARDAELEKVAASLPPVDGGKHAWVFLASAFMVE